MRTGWTGRRLAVCLLLGACTARGYDPPMQGDHATPAYVKDLRRCTDLVDLRYRQANQATPGAAIGSVFQSGAPERQDIANCMQSKGYSKRPDAE